MNPKSHSTKKATKPTAKPTTTAAVSTISEVVTLDGTVMPVKTKAQIAAEKAEQKAKEKTAAAILKKKQTLLKFLDNTQHKVFASLHINSYGNPEFHKFNTLKDAEESLESYKDDASDDVPFVGCIVEFTKTQELVPLPTPKNKKKMYDYFPLA